VDYIEVVSVEAASLCEEDETRLAGTSALPEDGDVCGVVVEVAVVAAQDECKSVVAERPLGAIYSGSVGRTHNVRSDSSELGFAASHCCTGRSTICCGCSPVAQHRKRRHNRLQMMNTVTAVG
jgi:hypothetical protein